MSTQHAPTFRCPRCEQSTKLAPVVPLLAFAFSAIVTYVGYHAMFDGARNEYGILPPAVHVASFFSGMGIFVLSNVGFAWLCYALMGTFVDDEP